MFVYVLVCFCVFVARVCMYVCMSMMDGRMYVYMCMMYVCMYVYMIVKDKSTGVWVRRG
jgi:hypothetical protein